MSTTTPAPGLPADWLNGWLAAIGATVMIPGLRLAWTDEAVPTAVFQSDAAVDLYERIAAVLPSEQSLRRASIARILPSPAIEFTRNVTLEAFADRARRERQNGTYELAGSVSDLRANADLDDLDHGAFDPPAPRGETLWSRALSCANMLSGDRDLATEVQACLDGTHRRAHLNGLGFDCRRLPTGLQGSVHADPIVELLCFCALAIFPTRGDGRVVRQRGWADTAAKRGAFKWVAWRPLLDCWAIDAFLDLRPAPSEAVIARYSVVPYRPAGAADVTRAYFAERVR